MRRNIVLISLIWVILMSSGSCLGQYLDADIRKELSVRQRFDSLELRQKFERKVKYCNKNEFVIRVNDQHQFDLMSTSVLKALKEGKRNIKVKINKGTYFFNERHLSFRDLHYPDADIRIVGKNVTVVPIGFLLNDGDEVPTEVSGESSYVNLSTKTPISTWSEMMYADSLIEVVDLAAKVCRIKCKLLKDVSLPVGNQAYLDLTRWCRCYQYKILSIENGNIYFYAHDLEKDAVFHKDEYNVNYDYIYAKAIPRFRLCNVEQKGDISVLAGRVFLGNALKSVLLGNASNFMTVRDTELDNLTINGISFLGGMPSLTPFFEIRNTKAQNIEVANCRFVGQRNKIMKYFSTDNLYFHHNYIIDNYDYGIETDNNASDIYIVNNRFENNGTNMSFTRCISCRGRNYYVAHNTFKNFGYCAISVGLEYGSVMENPSGGIVEYNHICYDNEHFENAWKYTIMDSGAIYVWTQNKDAIIRYNYIHDYTGMRQNRGIYLDDGAKGVSVYGNIVMNIPNMHSIDSRRVAGTEAANNKISKSEINNVNNSIMYNMTDGTINFVGNEMVNNGCVKGKNFLLSEKGNNRPHHEYKPLLNNFETEVKDDKVNVLGHDEKGLIVSKKALEEMKKLPCYDRMKRYVRAK